MPRSKGSRARPTADNFEGLVTHTDMEPVGQFTCSNPLINRIYQNARWGTRMQNRSVPMEPDRDERMPWSGHPAKTSESEGYAFNVARFYDHFLHNYRVHQGDGRQPPGDPAPVLDVQLQGHHLAQRHHDHPRLVLQLLRRPPPAGRQLTSA